MRAFALITLFCANLCIGQTLHFDHNWNLTIAPNSTYHRKSTKKLRKGFWIIDVDKNDNIIREGFLYNSQKNNFDGIVSYYYPNGGISKTERYKKGIKNGICKTYFNSGELHQMFRFRNGKRDGIFKEFNKIGKIKTKGKYNKGMKVGVWKTYYKNEYNDFLSSD